MKKDILATPKGKAVKLSDGKTYNLSPLNLTTLANLEEEFDCDMDELGAKLVASKRTAGAFRGLLWVLLQENYPEISKVDAGKLVEMEQVGGLIKDLLALLMELRT